MELDFHGVATTPMAADNLTCFRVNSIDELVRELHTLAITPTMHKDISSPTQLAPDTISPNFFVVDANM